MSLDRVLDPAGPQSAHIAHLFRIFFWVSLAVWAAVTISLVWAILRRRGPPPETAANERFGAPARDRVPRRIVALAIATTVVTLFALLTGSVLTGRAIGRLGGDDEVVVRVTGHQFWWDFRVIDSEPSRIVTSANELHIPTGRPIRLEVTSSDVIHSFWVPELHGKIDLVPGKKNTIVLRADRPGTFRGRCAEFCGAQHAKMGFLIVAEPPSAYEAWRERMLTPAREPTAEQERRGREVFLRTRCSSCHTISGTDARGNVGPDLTHVGARWAIGAGALPNTAASLSSFIADPHASKPGVSMPSNPMPAGESEALVAYLRSLE